MATSATAFASVADRDAIEAEMPWASRKVARTMYQFLTETKAAHGAKPAITFQLLSGPATKASGSAPSHSAAKNPCGPSKWLTGPA